MTCLRKWVNTSTISRQRFLCSSKLVRPRHNVIFFILNIPTGVPAIRFAQKHGAMNLLNLSTIATFFSAVTATCLQYSFASLNSSIANAVNGFWFTSLVFSIAAAVNSLLGLTWKQAM